MNVLIIGFGSIGKRHANILRALQCNVAIVTSYPEPTFQCYKNLKDVNLELYNYIIIATPTFRHFDELAFLDLHTKNKIILVEKPLFMETQIVQTFKNNTIFVAYNLRYSQIIQQIKNIIGQKKVLSCNIHTGSFLPSWRIGEDYSLRYSASKEQGGGVLLDLSHEIDYLLWWFGHLDVQCSINKKVSNLQITSDDFETFIAIAKPNIIINCTLDYISKIPQRNILIHTDDSTIVADLISGNLKLISSNGECITSEYKDDIKNSYHTMHAHILKNQFDTLCTFSEGLKVLETIKRLRNV